MINISIHSMLDEDYGYYGQDYCLKISDLRADGKPNKSKFNSGVLWIQDYGTFLKRSYK